MQKLLNFLKAKDEVIGNDFALFRNLIDSNEFIDLNTQFDYISIKFVPYYEF